MERKFLKRGMNFNIILVGESGMGKTTLVNTIFAGHLVDSQGRRTVQGPQRKTTEIVPTTQVIEENNVTLRLTVVDTPGFGDQTNNEGCWVPVIKYIKDQHAAYLERELKPQRERSINDTRVHACLYFLNPGSKGLRPIDIEVLKRLTEVVNVIPVLAKADSTTVEERAAFKKRIKEELAMQRIQAYPYPSEEDDEEDIALNNKIKELSPFAVVGSENVFNENGAPVRGRRHAWGIINVDNPEHCDFVHLRNFMLRTHLYDLIEVTAQRHYESFRTQQLRQIKEMRAAQAQNATQMAQQQQQIQPGATLFKQQA
ncbi:Septin-like protein [Zancudomyces culisetae]|uniref:Septin-like protein n=1 Tax=Zancudomyces culisetae TaxID=1213189 RepID=A0A1R1PDQ3_ZANCU|nr:Septin-like protein [Zancudomyces culisetae]|eukprot:OMH79114.1 Septin-like protein [Zancudomyces culisetae]